MALYTREVHTPTVKVATARVRATGGTLCTSSLAYPEARAGLASQRRARRLRATPYARALADLDADWGAVTVLELSEPLALLAGGLAEAHALKGADAAHLATALYLAREPEGAVLLTFDTALELAARTVGVAVWAP